MIPADSQIPEDHEVALLAAYDDALAAGQVPALDEPALAALGPAAAGPPRLRGGRHRGAPGRRRRDDPAGALPHPV